MFIVRLIIAGFLVSLNIFSFLLVKCQKNDREKKILEGVAEGNAQSIDFDEKVSKPSKEEVKTAQHTLETMDKKSSEEKEILPSDTEYDMPKDKKQQKEEKIQIMEKYAKKPVSDFKLFLCAILGGAIGIYVALFVFRYRLRDILMMVLIPTILVINIYFYLQVYTVWLILPLLAT